jgi:hypothetical protein
MNIFKERGNRLKWCEWKISLLRAAQAWQWLAIGLLCFMVAATLYIIKVGHFP